MARKQVSEVPVADAPAPDGPAPDGPAPEVSTARGRKFVRIFLMAAGGLAAPCLALAAFFLSNSGGSDAPAKSAGVVHGSRVTTTTAARPRTIPTTASAPTTTTTMLAPVPLSPSRDPFAPLVSRASAGGGPAR